MNAAERENLTLTRYLVGRDAKVQVTMAKILPDRVMDRLILRALKDDLPAM